MITVGVTLPWLFGARKVVADRQGLDWGRGRGVPGKELGCAPIVPVANRSDKGKPTLFCHGSILPLITPSFQKLQFLFYSITHCQEEKQLSPSPPKERKAVCPRWGADWLVLEGTF